MCIIRGYWPNSALHGLFGVFLCTLRMLLQNSACRASIVFLSLSLSLSHTHSLSVSLSLFLTHTHAHAHAHTLSHTHTHTRTHTDRRRHTHTHTDTLSLSLSLSLSHTHTHTQTDAHTHTHTHRHTHTDTLSLTHTHTHTHTWTDSHVGHTRFSEHCREVITSGTINALCADTSCGLQRHFLYAQRSSVLCPNSGELPTKTASPLKQNT